MTESANHPLTPHRLDDPVEVERYCAAAGRSGAESGRVAGPRGMAAIAAESHRAGGARVLGTIGDVPALLTPFLPLQSPIQTATDRSFEPPTIWPVFITTPEISPDAQSGDAATPAGETPPWITKTFGEVGPINRWLIGTRVRLFGRWSVNSLCGRDELGRDLFARLFWGARISLMAGLVAALVSLIDRRVVWRDFRICRRMGR